MWLDWVSNLGPQAPEADALPTALSGPAPDEESLSLLFQCFSR